MWVRLESIIVGNAVYSGGAKQRADMASSRVAACMAVHAVLTSFTVCCLLTASPAYALSRGNRSRLLNSTELLFWHARVTQLLSEIKYSTRLERDRETERDRDRE